jgi:hypothetical protein
MTSPAKGSPVGESSMVRGGVFYWGSVGCSGTQGLPESPIPGLTPETSG